MAAQRYPKDFDGIIAGALANRHIQMHTSGVYRGIEVDAQAGTGAVGGEGRAGQQPGDDHVRHAEGRVPQQPARLQGGLLQARLHAAAPTTPGCLTKGQMQSVETFYGGVKNSKGELIFSGQALGNPIGPRRPIAENATPGGGYDTVRIWGFQNENYDWRHSIWTATCRSSTSKVGFVDAVDPDLRKFKSRGGKLLLYAGWGDTTITPENTVLYYDSVLKEMGKDQGNWTRLFLVPGHGALRRRPGHRHHRYTRDTGTVAREGAGACADHGHESRSSRGAQRGGAGPCRARSARIRSSPRTKAAATSRTQRTGPARRPEIRSVRLRPDRQPFRQTAGRGLGTRPCHSAMAVTAADAVRRARREACLRDSCRMTLSRTGRRSS